MNTLCAYVILGMLQLFFRTASLLATLRHRYYIFKARVIGQPFVDEESSFYADLLGE